MAQAQETSQESLFFSSVAEGNSTSVDALLRGVDVNTINLDGQSALHLAAKQGSTHLVKQLINKSANTELSDRHGMTPLMDASQNGHIEVVKLLLSKNVDASRRTGNGEPAVFFALMSGHVEIAKLLEIKAKCLSQLPEQLRMSILTKAVEDNQKSVIEFMNSAECLDSESNHRNLRRLASLACSNENSSVELLALFKVKFDQPGEDGSSILCCAVKNGLYDQVEYIVNNGCDVSHNMECVQEAVRSDRLQILKLLRMKNAPMYDTDTEGYTPLQRAVLHGSVEMFQYLLDQNCSTKRHPSLGSLALIAATKTKVNQTEILKELIQRGVPVDEPHPDTEDTPLLALCQKGPIEAVNLLLENRCNGSAKNKDGITPALQATKHKNESILRLLGDKDAALNISDRNAETPIMRAGRDQSLSMVRYLANQKCTLDGKDANGMTIVHYASEANNLPLLKFLQEKKVRLDVPDWRGVTPLMTAIDNWGKGSMDIVKLLVSGPNAPNVNKRDWNGKSAIQHAVGKGKLELVQYLKANCADLSTIDHAGNTLLLESVKLKESNVLVKFLISSGCDLHAANDEQESPVHYACMQQENDLLMSLLEAMAPADIQDKKGVTPFMISSMHGNESLILTLRSIRPDVADVNKRTLNGRNATHMAAQRGSLKVLRSFSMFGCALDQEDNNGDTPLILACSTPDHATEGDEKETKEMWKVAEYLIDNCAKPNALNYRGRAAIHYACEFGSLELLRVLKQKGADLDVPDAESVTPFMLAARKQPIEVLKFLYEKGSNVELVDSSGRTALHYAVEGNNSSVIRFLVSKLNLDPSAVDGFKMSPVMTSIKINSKSALDELQECGALLHEEFNDQDQNPAYFACMKSNFELMKKLKNKEISLCSETKSKDNCLTIASGAGSEEIVAFLFEGENKPLIDHKNKDGNTALMCAAQNMHLALIPVLIRQNARVKEVNANGRNVLHILCSSTPDYENGDSSSDALCDAISNLISSQMPLNEKDGQGKTALHLACGTRNRRVVELLLDKGAALEEKDANGETPIFTAIRSEKIELVELLIERRASLEVQNEKGVSPITIAVEINNVNISELIGPATRNFDANKLTENVIDSVFRMHDLRHLDFLLTNGFEGTRTKSGKALLHSAVQMGDAELLKSIVSRKDQPRYTFLQKIVNSSDSLGNTPLHMSIRLNRLDMADLLFELGSRVDIRNHKGFTPLHVAACCNKLSLVKWFYEKENVILPLDPSREEPAGVVSPLHLAAIRGNISIFQFLESKGFQKTGKCSNGNTCAHYAAIHGNLPILRHIEKSVSEVLSEKNNRNMTPFHYAVLHGNEMAAQFLYNHVIGGALPPNILHLAIHEGHQHMVNWLLNLLGDHQSQEDEATGETTIWHAFGSGNFHLVDQFLTEENLRVLTKHEDSLAHSAARANHAHLLRLLQAKGAQLDSENKDGNTPIMDCAQLGHYESLQLLDQFGYNLSATNSKQRSIVHLTCIIGAKRSLKQEQRLRILQLAYERSLPMDAPDSQGNTALIYASHFGLQQLVSFLLDTARCDPNKTNETGTAAVHLAARAGHTDVLKILQQGRANLQLKDSKGTTPIMIALFNEQFDALKYLLESNFEENAQDTHGRSLRTLAAFASEEMRAQLEKHGVEIDAVAQQPNLSPEENVGFDICTTLCEHPELVDATADEDEDPEILPDESVAGTNNYIIPCRTGVSQGHQTIDSVSVAQTEQSLHPSEVN